MTVDQLVESPNYMQNYLNSIYFMTTTMTSVGYGDYNASRFAIGMLYLISIQFFGMLAFSLIKEQVFGAR